MIRCARGITSAVRWHKECSASLRVLNGLNLVRSSAHTVWEWIPHHAPHANVQTVHASLPTVHEAPYVQWKSTNRVCPKVCVVSPANAWDKCPTRQILLSNLTIARIIGQGWFQEEATYWHAIVRMESVPTIRNVVEDHLRPSGPLHFVILLNQMVLSATVWILVRAWPIALSNAHSACVSMGGAESVSVWKMLVSPQHAPKERNVNWFRLHALITRVCRHVQDILSAFSSAVLL